MPNSSPLLPTEIIRFIEATGESHNIDAKGPMSWDGANASAGLAKDIAAFANSRDGGVIVLGKSEPVAGNFIHVGLSEPEAASFDTTKVANWVNNRFGPPIRLVCHRQEHLGKTFIVITIAEFDDIPHICIKSFQDQTNPKNHILKEGTIYVRNASATSVPITSIDDLRTLIGLATGKRGREMLSMFESMLRGRPLLAPPSDQDLYDKEFQRVSSSLGKPFQEKIEEGAWVLRLHPMTYAANRWKTQDELEKVIQKRSVRLRDEFPPSHRGTHMREWGICNDAYGDVWTLARSGQFIYVRSYRENTQSCHCPWMTFGGRPAEPSAPAGQWIDFKSNLFRICEMWMFVVRMVEEYDLGESVFFDLRATNLAGRRLLTMDHNIDLFPMDECRASSFEMTKQVSAEELRADWERMCAEAMRQFIELFPGSHLSDQVMLAWIQKFKNREF